MALKRSDGSDSSSHNLPEVNVGSDLEKRGDLSPSGKAEGSLPVTVDAALERRITRKLDLHLLPWLFGIWLLAFIDRSNIGNARIDGLEEEFHMEGNNRFNIALTVFYILYILVDVPSNWVLKHVGAGFYIPGLMMAWGLVSTFMGMTKSYAGLVVCRLLLGLFEGGLFGGLILYLSMFYRRHQLLLRIGLWYCAAPLSGAIGGLLAAGLSRIQYGGYNRWPWIFIVEGAVTVVFATVAVFFLPHTPAKSRFFTEEERHGAILRLHVDAHGADAKENVDLERFSWKWVRMAILNVNSALLCFNFFTILVPIYSFSLFLPTIISDLGYKGVIAQLFTVPPNMGGFFSVLVIAYTSDRFKTRGPFIIGCGTCAIIGYIMLLAADRPAVRYGGTFFVAVGVFPSSPTATAWLSNNLAPHYVRATGTGLQVGIGNCAAFIATFTYLTKDRPRYITGHSINLGMLVLTLITTLVTMLYCRMENSKRAKGQRDGRLSEGAEEMLGHRHPNFRYTI